MPSNLYRPLTKPKPQGRGSQENLASPLVRRAGNTLHYLAWGWLFLCFFSSLGGSQYAARRLPSWRKSVSTTSRPSPTGWCDPFSLPGFVSSLAGTASNTLAPLGVWRTYDSSCQSSTHLPSLLATLSGSPYHGLMQQEHLRNAQSLSHIMSNKTVLLVGDMVDRSLVEGFCQLTGGQIQAVHSQHAWGREVLTQVPKEMANSRDAATYQMAHYCYVPQFDFLLTSVYHYGIDETNAWSQLPLYHSPGLFEDRVQHLFQKYLAAASNPVLASSALPSVRRSAKPDLVFYQSSFWDLALWAQQDIDAGSSAVSDLPEDRLLTWRSRNVDMLASLASAFGQDVPILWRSIHYPTDNAGATVEWFTGQEDPAAKAAGSVNSPDAAAPTKKNHPLFHLNRIQQLNHAQLSTLMPSGDDVVRGKRNRAATLPDSVQLAPWGQVLIGQDHMQQDMITPSANPGGSIFAEMVLWNLEVSNP